MLGPNGAGKTTTIKMLATLLKPDSGSVQIFGHDVVKESHIVRQLVGVTGQYASVDESLTANENLMIFARLLGLSRKDAKSRTEELLAEFGLSKAANRSLKNFSGGMRRRLDLAASLIVQPPLLFLDEPTTGLDPRSRIQIWDTIRQLVQKGSTILLTTQYLDEADQLADRIAVIDRGRVIAEGTVDELKSSVGNSSVHLKVDSENVDNTRQIVGEFLPKHAITETGHITAPIENVHAVTNILVALRTAGIDILEISVQKPTLDEVFLTITGHGVEQESSEEGLKTEECR